MKRGPFIGESKSRVGCPAVFILRKLSFGIEIQQKESTSGSDTVL